jgi:glycosyltransferase involved in cell wall biosynthesis
VKILKEKLVSIIAPAYNHEDFIFRTINSVANQTYENKELIIIDDFSKDKTVEKIEETLNKNEIKNKFPGGIIFKQHSHNIGAHNTINEGLSLANGEYLTIINTDDIFQSNRLKVMIEKMEKEKSELSFSKVSTINKDGEFISTKKSKDLKELQNAANEFQLSLTLAAGNVAISTGNMVFTRSLIETIGKFKNLEYIHDWDFIIRAALYTEPVFVKKTTYFYRLHGKNAYVFLDTNARLIEEESIIIFTNFFKRIQNKEYTNTKIPEEKMWANFINNIMVHPRISFYWDNAKKATNFRTY